MTEKIKETYDFLAILTKIQIFDQTWLLENESGLTLEKILIQTSNIKNNPKQINFKYEIGPTLNFNFMMVE